MPNRQSRVRRLLAAALAAGAATAGLTACTSERPDPAPVAAAVAQGLSAGDLAGVPVAEGLGSLAQEQLQTALGELRPTVAVSAVEVPEDSGVATARFEVGWDLDATEGVDWTYQTRGELALAEVEGGDEAWALRWAPGLVEPSLESGEQLSVRRTTPERGQVLGADGQVLVSERPVLRLGIDKTRVAPRQAAGSARALARVLDIDPGSFAGDVSDAGPRAFVEAIVLRSGDPLLPGDETIDGIAGAVVIEDSLPLAPSREFARALLGTVGPATAEAVEDSDGRLVAGDLAGLSGLQSRYDDRLQGTPGLVVRALPPEPEPEAEQDAPESEPEQGATEGEADVEQAQPRELFRREPEPGQDLALTLDPRLQQLADDVLAEVEPASAVVAVRPSDGHLLAVASGPGGEGYSTATQGRYAPGSTFKVVSSLALLRAGLTPESPVPCTESVSVNGKRFENYDDYPTSRVGEITLRQAIANSCNTALIAEREQTSQTGLSDAAAALGLGVDLDLGAPAFLGSVPAQAEETEAAASMIGQGKLEASPLAMAVTVASVAAGERVVPRLVRQPAPEDPAADSAEPLTKGEAEQLRGLMRAVVTEGSGAFLQDVPGPDVHAKTGTAEFGTELPLSTHAWMVATRGDLAVAVFVEDGESGSQTAGPLLEEFLRGADR